MKKIPLTLLALSMACFSFGDNNHFNKRIKLITDENGNQMEFQYDQQDRITKLVYNKESATIDWDARIFYSSDEAMPFTMEDGKIKTIGDYDLYVSGDSRNYISCIYQNGKMEEWDRYDFNDDKQRELNMRFIHTWDANGNLIQLREQFPDGRSRYDNFATYNDETGQPELLHSAINYLAIWFGYFNLRDVASMFMTPFYTNLGIESKHLVTRVEQTEYEYRNEVYYGYGISSFVYKYEKDATGMIKEMKIMNESNQSSGHYLYFDWEESTGIDEIKTESKTNTTFDMQGRKVKNPHKGLYIVNGKKRIVK